MRVAARLRAGARVAPAAAQRHRGDAEPDADAGRDDDGGRGDDAGELAVFFIVVHQQAGQRDNSIVPRVIVPLYPFFKETFLMSV